MSNSKNKELYDFLSNYDLIQTDQSEDEIIESLDQINNKLNENENFLTGFFANTEDENPTVFFVTDQSRLVSYPENESLPSDINISDISSVKTEGNKLNIDIEDKQYTLNAKNDKGAEVLEDALYSSFSELFSDDRIEDIFDSEKLALEEDTEAEPSEEIAEVEEIEEEQLPEVVSHDLAPVEENSIAPVENNENVDQIVFTTQEQAALPEPEAKNDVSEINFNEKGTGIVQSGKSDKFHFKLFGKEFDVSRKTAYICGGILLAVLACVIAYFAYQFYQQNKKQQELTGVIAYYNEIDGYFKTATELADKGQDGVTADQWEDIETKATDMEATLNDYEVNADDDRLYQDVYFFNESIITAAYYGRNFVNSGNALFKSSLDTNLDIAKQYRLAVLSLIEEKYPDLMDSLDRPLTDEEAASVNPQEVIDKQNEANSTPSEGAANRENSKSSNMFQESSESTRENRSNN